MPIIKILPHSEYCPQGAQVTAPAGTSICEALLELSESTRQTAASLQDSHAALATLAGTARQLRTGVERFKVAA